ncbi:MAG: hypothetical protein R3244_07670 [Thermoanaerobaculia bacterium]|nr:hypothetical protein [Thermoanaerobaculia bacterium]
MQRYEEILDASKERVERAMEEAIDAGFAESSDREGRLLVPVRAGIRAGVVEVDWSAEPLAEGTRLRLEVIEEVFRTSTAAVSILAIGAAGGIMTVVWPLHPDLLGLAPLGALLALLAWLLVVSRLRSYGPEDFLSTVADLASEEEDSIPRDIR